MSYDEFLQKAEEKYPERFQYPEENRQYWAGSHGTTKIVCEKHGELDILVTTFLNTNTHGCTECAKEIGAHKQTLSQEEYDKRLKNANNNIVRLGEYINLKTHILHQCTTCEHTWSTVPPSVLRSAGCPECGKSHYRERWTREVLEELFGTKFPSIRPDWLINPETGRKLEVDCYSEELGLGLEYQGTQHYEPVEFWGGSEALLRNQKKDRVKTNTFMQKKEILWRIDNRPLQTLKEEEFKQAIREKIKRLALSEHHTPVWNPNSKKIKSFFLTNNNKRVTL
jgi:predicted  nucleic acid-binding Zn-ribbon protein